MTKSANETCNFSHYAMQLHNDWDEEIAVRGEKNKEKSKYKTQPTDSMQYNLFSEKEKAELEKL